MDRHRHQNRHTKQKHEKTDKKIIQAQQTIDRHYETDSRTDKKKMQTR